MSDPASIHPIVVKVGGAAVDDPSDALWSAIAQLHRDHPGGVVLVHGGGALVDRRLERLGMASQRREGIRITPPEQMDEVVAGLAGCANTAVVGSLQRHGARAVGLTLGDGGTIRCAKSMRYAFEPGRVGDASPGDASLLDTLLRARFLPVLSSIGLDEHGAPLNVNADEAAAAVGALVRASALVLLTDVPGVLDADNRLIDELAPDTVELLIARGIISGGMIVKARSAARTACDTGIPVVVASWRSPHDLPRLARSGAAGTRFLPPALVP